MELSFNSSTVQLELVAAGKNSLRKHSFNSSTVQLEPVYGFF